MMEVRLIEKFAKIVAERRRERGHASPGFDEMFGPSRGWRAAADDDCRLAAQIEKNRQMAHGYRAPDRNARGVRSGEREIRWAGVQITRRPF